MITLMVVTMVKWGVLLGIWASPFPLLWSSGGPFILTMIDLALTCAIIALVVNILGQKKGWWQ